VVVAAQNDSSPEAATALETLCGTYWYPLYAYVRRCGRGTHDAQDLTQEFFARLLEKDFLHSVDREKGRLRTFLIVALKRFLANEWDRQSREKRGGKIMHVPFDAAAAEQRYASEPTSTFEADAMYDRRWALTLLDQTLRRLQEEFGRSGRAEDFDCLKGYLTASKQAIQYGEVAAALGTSEGAARVAVHRLRKRFREVFREEIAQTVAATDDIEAEVRHLVGVLSGG